MNKLIYIGWILSVLIISGCTSPTQISRTDDGTKVYYTDTGDYDQIRITDYGYAVWIKLEDNEGISNLGLWAFCEDEVICYEYDGTSCFRHKDLVEKYCTIIEDARWKTELKKNKGEPIDVVSVESIDEVECYD